MKKNYGSLADLEEEIKNVDNDDFLEIDYGGRYEFARCEGCDGPLLGHLQVKCGEKQGVRYWSEAVRSFENWIKRVPGFREAVNARQQKKEKVRSAKIGEYLEIAIETVDKITDRELLHI